MKKTLIMTVLCLGCMAAKAQQNLNWGQGPQVASPVVNADKSVTFNLIAPEAQKVQITGDFLPSNKVEYQGTNAFANIDPDACLAHFATNGCQNFMPVIQFYAEHSIR